MTFNELNLNKSLLNALTDMGYTTPTTIQERAFSVVMSGRDMVGIAQTGTGKTLAYLLPCLRLWNFTNEKHPQILVIVPTRELVAQVVEAVKNLTTYMNFSVVGVYGGVNIKTQIAEVAKGVDMVVATPGRLIDLTLTGSLKLKHIKKLVIDEVDEILNLGFRTQLTQILDLLPPRRQNLMFSATMVESVAVIIEDSFNTPQLIEAAPTGTPLENIIQQSYKVPNFNTKINLLKLILSNKIEFSKVLVFVATKKLADDIYEGLELFFPTELGVIHSNKDQNFRFNAVKQFQAGTVRILIATDIIARGLDISEVTHVLNFDTPDVPENYIHRIGRTGRADKKGISITFVTPKEEEYLDEIQTLMSYEVPILDLPTDLVISDILTEDELPKVKMKNILVKVDKKEEAGPAFHEKIAKNLKVNNKIRRKEQMKIKYKKPKTRGQKK